MRWEKKQPCREKAGPAGPWSVKDPGLPLPAPHGLAACALVLQVVPLPDPVFHLHISGTFREVLLLFPSRTTVVLVKSPESGARA